MFSSDFPRHRLPNSTNWGQQDTAIASLACALCPWAKMRHHLTAHAQLASKLVEVVPWSSFAVCSPAIKRKPVTTQR
eukprot:141352-Rhodomonas_salina.1